MALFQQSVLNIYLGEIVVSQNWHELTFRQFLAELKKKVTLSPKEKAEWMEYFNEQKTKAGELKSQNAGTDAEIDAMVYELYGLSEEVKVVEEE